MELLSVPQRVDLFDDEGFSLSVVNGKPVTQDSDDGDCELSADEERDLQEAKVGFCQESLCVLCQLGIFPWRSYN